MNDAAVPTTCRELRSTVTEDGEATLVIGECDVPEPGPDEVVVRVGAGVADVNCSRPRAGIRTNVPIGVIRVVPDVLVLVTPPVFIALPAGVAIARSFLLVGPVQFGQGRSGHDDIAPRAAAARAALDVRREV